MPVAMTMAMDVATAMPESRATVMAMAMVVARALAMTMAGRCMHWPAEAGHGRPRSAMANKGCDCGLLC